MDNAQERLLFEHLGSRALAFLLATNEDMLRLRIDDPAVNSLNQLQEQVLAQLVELDGQFGGWHEAGSSTGEWATRLATRLDSGPQMSLGNFVRELSGGDLLGVPKDLEPVEAKVIEVALENYPGMIVKESDDPLDRMMRLPSMRYKNLLIEEFEKVLIEDADFKKLFTKKDEASGWSGYSMRSSGQGNSHQVWGFADTLVNSGLSYAKLNTDIPTPQELIDGILFAINKIRSAINGDQTAIPARIGLTGMKFPEGVDEMDLGWAKVRRADTRDERFIKATTLNGQLTGTNHKGETTVINYSGDLVAEIDIPYVIEIGEHSMGKFSEKLRIGMRKTEEVIENLRLGLLLAYPDDKLVLHTSWQVTLDPLTQCHSAGWNDVTKAVNLMPTLLTKTQVTNWSKWAALIGANRIPTIGVSIRRMLATVGERRTHEDILVDAVIVWENLFGASTETTLRVTSSLAWLLGKNAKDRLEKQSLYKTIYGFRSYVVHGNPKVNEQKLAEYSQEATKISIATLATLFGKRTDLLIHKSSEERSIAIIHQGNTKSSK